MRLIRCVHLMLSPVVAGMVLILSSAFACAAYPDRAVTMVVPYPPGGSTDMIAREYADRLSKALSQSVIVENRPGAATNIGGAIAARAKADGYTLFYGTNSLILNPIFGPTPSFEGTKAFTPVSLVAEVSFMVGANPKVAFDTPEQMVELGRENPGILTISSAQLHLYVELLKARAEVDLLHVPYKGGAQSVTDTIAGQVDMVFALVPVVLPHIKTGTIKPIAVTAAKRVAALPNVPTLSESGVPYELSIWQGLFVPVGTPDSVISRLEKAAEEIAKAQDFSEKLGQNGVTLVSSAPQELGERVQAEISLWQDVARIFPELVKTDTSK